MSLVFTTTGEVTAANGVKVIVYADAGTGKTSLCATAPAPIIISAEAGLLSLRRKNIERMYGVETPGITYDIPVIPVTTVDELKTAYEWCYQHAKQQGFQTVCLDSISEIAEVVLSNAKAKSKDGRMAYGDMAEQMTTTIRAFRDLPNLNVYMTSKMAPLVDGGGVTKFGPAMPGKNLGNALPYFPDELFRLAVAKDEKGAPYRFLQTQPDLLYMAKDRSGSLAPMEHPHLGYIFNKILSE